MRSCPRTLRRRFLPPLFFTLVSLPALSQNVLVNPGFDRDLSGWTARVNHDSSTVPTPDTYVAWEPADASSSAASGGAGLHAKAIDPNTLAAVGQCVPVRPPAVATFGALFLVRSERLSFITTTAGFFASADCSGPRLSLAFAPALPSSPTLGSDSGGAWLPVRMAALVPDAARSLFFEATAQALWTWSYGNGWADVVADDAFLTLAPSQPTVSILPSAAWIAGLGAYWRTGMTLVNPGAADAAVTLKWLGHDVDGRGGSERAYLVPAGQTLVLPDDWEANHPQTYGAILVTSSSPSVFLQSETSTGVAGGGTVGQALPAFGPNEFAGSTPKTLAPIRENAAFRTNLVLANPTQIPVTANVALYAANGTLVGTKDVPLFPLGMTQINRVASELGASSLDSCRLSVSTTTPGGLVAAYASIIDNVTNDPRTLLPQDATQETPGPNLVANGGFDRDLSDWVLDVKNAASPAINSAEWSADDANGRPGSGSARLFVGPQDPFTSAWVLLSQCLSAEEARTYGARVKVRSDSSKFGSPVPPSLFLRFAPSASCLGNLGYARSEFPPFNELGPSWFTLPSWGTAPAGTRSVLVGLYLPLYGGFPGASAVTFFDDVAVSEGPSTWTSVVPSAASIGGVGTSLWTTDLTLSNPGASSATAYVNFSSMAWTALRSDFAANLEEGQTLTLREVVHESLGLSHSALPLSIHATSPGIAVTAETSTPVPGGGTVGQALPAFQPRDLAGSAPKSIAPVRDDAAFRTNLVLANTTSSPLVAHVDLYDASAVLVGSRDVPLDLFGFAQIDRVGRSLAGGDVAAGRLSISTPTPGGLVAAYASVIDNVTNDPRTLLPR